MCRRPALEALEGRVVPAGTWANLAASGTGPASGGGAMMLLSDGSILIQNGSNPPPSASFFKLSPQANTGSYVNGSWSGGGTMNEPRLFFSTAMMPNGNVFAVGGEYPKFSNTAEVYNSTTNSWSYVDPAPTLSTNVDLNGAITGASNASPITITTASTQQLQNGFQVTIAGVGGNTAANGTFTVANVTATSFQLVGSAGNGNYTGGGSWNSYTPQYGDDPIEVLPNGQILAGYWFNATTYLVNPSAAAGSQWTPTTNTKLHGDQSDEEAWVKLPDGSILSYDVYASAGGTFQAQRYDPASGLWKDASTLSAANPPSVLTSGNQGSELGPGFLQSNNKVIYFGSNGNTAIYDVASGTWSAGPAEPQKNLTITPDAKQNHYTVTNGGAATALVGTDDPGAVLPNGHILIALSPLGPLKSNGAYSFPEASYIYDYDPIAQTFTDVTPGGLSGVNAFQLNMVVLPTGQVLLSNEGNPFQIYTEDPATGPQASWKPTVASIVDSGGGTYTLTGTQLNGIDEGANYGDDNESASNYPIVQLKDSGGNVYDARTFNWSSTGVATGAAPVTTQFTLPAGHGLSDFTSLTVIANGIPSDPVPFHITPVVTPPPDQVAVEGASTSISIGSFVDPDGGPWAVDVNWGDGSADTTFTATTAGPLGSVDHTFAEEGTDTVKVTVTDGTSLSGSATFHVAVSDPAVVPTGAVVHAVEGADSGPVVVATFTDPGGAESLADYSATIDWGDGHTSAGVLSFAGGVFTVTGDHTYAEESAPEHAGSYPSYAILVTIGHESAPAATANSHAFVSDPSVVGTGGFAINALECQALTSVAVATFTDPGGPEARGDYGATIDWGDGHTSAGVISGPVGGVYTVSDGNTFAEDGTYTITVTLHHEESPDVVVTGTAIVHDNIGILLLDPGGSGALTATGNASVTVSDVNQCGAIIVNSSSRSAGVAVGNAVVTAGEYDFTGTPGTSTSGHGVFAYQDEKNTGEAPTADPLAGVPVPTPSATPHGAVNDTGGPLLILSPGTYVGGIHVSGKGSVRFLPGVYDLEGGGFSVSGQGSVSGDGVTFYNAPASKADGFSFTGQATVHLSGPTGGAYQSLVFFQDRASAATFQVAGNAVLDLTGIVYAAGAQVMVSGQGEVLDRGSADRTVSAAVDALDLAVTGNGVVAIDVSNNSPEGLHYGMTVIAPAAAFRAAHGMTSPPSDPGAAFAFATTGDTVGPIDHAAPGGIASRAPLTPANTSVARKLVAQSTTQSSTADWDTLSR